MVIWAFSVRRFDWKITCNFNSEHLNVLSTWKIVYIGILILFNSIILSRTIYFQRGFLRNGGRQVYTKIHVNLRILSPWWPTRTKKKIDSRSGIFITWGYARLVRWWMWGSIQRQKHGCDRKFSSFGMT